MMWRLDFSLVSKMGNSGVYVDLRFHLLDKLQVHLVAEQLTNL